MISCDRHGHKANQTTTWGTWGLHASLGALQHGCHGMLGPSSEPTAVQLRHGGTNVYMYSSFCWGILTAVAILLSTGCKLLNTVESTAM